MANGLPSRKVSDETLGRDETSCVRLATNQNSLIVKKFLSVAKMASTVYEKDISKTSFSSHQNENYLQTMSEHRGMVRVIEKSLVKRTLAWDWIPKSNEPTCLFVLHIYFNTTCFKYLTLS